MDCVIGTCHLMTLVTLGSAAGLKRPFKHMSFGSVLFPQPHTLELSPAAVCGCQFATKKTFE
jgi:hypothetical protein